MVQDESAESHPRPAAPRILLFTGVAGACALGAGLGLWARPSDLERPGAAPPPPPPAAVTPVVAERRIPIVVGDAPPPVERPLDALSQSTPRAAVIPHAAPRQLPRAAPAAPEMIAPSRPPTGLVRVVAPAPGPMSATPPVAAKPDPRLQRARAEAARLHMEKLRAARLAKAQHQRELAEQAAAAKAERIAEQAAEAKAQRLAEQKARHDRARAHEAELARAAAERKARHSLTVLAHAFAKLATHHARPAPEARAEAAPPPTHHKKSAHVTRAKAPPARPRPPRPEPLAPLQIARTARPIRVANTIPARCASSDPGEALACGDPGLTAAERRLARAYRDAEAAGVPATTLAQQQQRWKLARAAAAREAPWAVREVYQARIAELQDLARDAKGE